MRIHCGVRPCSLALPELGADSLESISSAIVEMPVGGQHATVRG